MRFKAVLFDLSDTLVLLDFERYAELLSRVVNSKLEKRDILELETFARRKIDKKILTRGPFTNLKDFWSFYFEVVFGFLKDTYVAKNAENDVVYQKLKDAFREIPSLWNKVNPDAHFLLKELKKQGLVLGVLSNGSTERAREKLKNFELLSLFDVVVGSDQVGVLKPAREFFDYVLNLLQISPKEAVYVGDYFTIDYLGALGAGLFAVLYDPHEQYPESGPRKIKRLAELTGFLK